MTALRVSLCSVWFVVLGACTGVEAPAASPDDLAAPAAAVEPAAESPADLPASPSALDPGGVHTSSLQTCLGSCNPDDQDCLDCCHCLAHGGTPQQCCF